MSALDPNQAASKYGHISDWDVSEVTCMRKLFYANGDDGGDERMKDFNEDLSRWNTGNVENMMEMFDGASSFESDLSCWNVSKVEDMNCIFKKASSFQGGDLSQWDVSKVENMKYMFDGASSFNSDLSGWDVSKVENMGVMFRGASSFNSDLSRWDVSKVENMTCMFWGASSFKGDGLYRWNVSKVEYMEYMFRSASSFNSDLTGWDTSKCQERMFAMFIYASSMPHKFMPKGSISDEEWQELHPSVRRSDGLLKRKREEEEGNETGSSDSLEFDNESL